MALPALLTNLAALRGAAPGILPQGMSVGAGIGQLGAAAAAGAPTLSSSLNIAPQSVPSAAPSAPPSAPNSFSLPPHLEGGGGAHDSGGTTPAVPNPQTANIAPGAAGATVGAGIPSLGNIVHSTPAAPETPDSGGNEPTPMEPRPGPIDIPGGSNINPYINSTGGANAGYAANHPYGAPNLGLPEYSTPLMMTVPHYSAGEAAANIPSTSKDPIGDLIPHLPSAPPDLRPGWNQGPPYGTPDNGEPIPPSWGIAQNGPGAWLSGGGGSHLTTEEANLPPIPTTGNANTLTGRMNIPGQTPAFQSGIDAARTAAGASPIYSDPAPAPHLTSGLNYGPDASQSPGERSIVGLFEGGANRGGAPAAPNPAILTRARLDARNSPYQPASAMSPGYRVGEMRDLPAYGAGGPASEAANPALPYGASGPAAPAPQGYNAPPPLGGIERANTGFNPGRKPGSLQSGSYTSPVDFRPGFLERGSTHMDELPPAAQGAPMPGATPWGSNAPLAGDKFQGGDIPLTGIGPIDTNILGPDLPESLVPEMAGGIAPGYNPPGFLEAGGTSYAGLPARIPRSAPPTPAGYQFSGNMPQARPDPFDPGYKPYVQEGHGYNPYGYTPNLPRPRPELGINPFIGIGHR
jgi:hypothetical protein